MAKNFSNEPDARTLVLVQNIENLVLGFVAVVAACVLALWLAPALDRYAPAFWSKMTANTAATMLLSVAALFSSTRQLAGYWRRLGIVLAMLVLLGSGLVLLEYATGLSFGIDAILPHRLAGPFPGRPTPQAAFAFLLLSICVLGLRQAKNIWSRLVDIVAMAFLALNFTLLGVDFFGTLHHIPLADRVIMSPQTLLSLFCFSTVVLLRRAEQGDLLAVLVNIGIGSRILRLMMPAVVVVPFLLLAAQAWLVRAGILTVTYSEALTAAAAAVLGLCVITWLGWRINALERDLRDLSLTDELTGVFNRRGFYFLGQQAIREAQRAGSGLSLFFFDLDGLKHVNDVLGHEIGSEMIKAFAAILQNTFRKSDIVGRVGGDEFAVITIRDNAMWIEHVYARLGSLTDAHNGDQEKAYRLSFSVGYAELMLGQADTLDSLVMRADGLMYQDKARKKLAA